MPAAEYIRPYVRETFPSRKELRLREVPAEGGVQSYAAYFRGFLDHVEHGSGEGGSRPRRQLDRASAGQGSQGVSGSRRQRVKAGQGRPLLTVCPVLTARPSAAYGSLGAYGPPGVLYFKLFNFR